MKMHFENTKFILLICSLTIAVCQADSIVICGDGLADMLMRICENGYNTRFKRTGAILPDYNAIDSENNANALDNFGAYSSIDYQRQPLLYAMLGESARHQLLSTRRRRFNIVEECCDKPCTTQELKMYCR
ncbi:bombyxin A-2 homolog [Drosophila sulfurigaster albostrigata]|uniref:Bombyxin A-2 homolog n=1 Tax=Drosophila albomicans TaxID=7291 RepID=A0A6P8YFR1_DROAB|nr:bombyxin A-2 homolog [Drosophila albomicans]XP_062132042.1 bombyxin A-2 homolog [Drosophila sulfurigaster albostrigata]